MISSLTFGILLIFLFISAVFSQGLFQLKLILLSVLLLKTIYDFYQNNIKIHQNILIFILLFVGYLSASIFYSISEGFGFNFSILSEYLLLPSIYFLAAYQVSKLIPVQKRVSLLYLITLFCILFNLLNFLRNFGFIDLTFPDFLKGPSRIEEGVLVNRLPDAVPLMFISPLVFLIKPFTKYQKIFKPYLVSLLILVGIFSGRRALQFSILSSFVLYIINFRYIIWDLFSLRIRTHKLTLNRIIKNSILALTLSLFIYIINNQFEIFSLLNSFSQTFLVIFDKAANTVQIRELQGEKLISEGFNKIFFGHGATANLTDYWRSNVTKWSYELRYHALFYQIGLIGIIMYLIIFIWVFKINIFANLVILNKNNYYSAIGLAFFIFIFLGHTNPFYTHPFPWIMSLATYYDLNAKK